MKKIIYSITCLVIVQVFLIACQEEATLSTVVPATADADFTFSHTTRSDNELVFTSASDNFVKTWKFSDATQLFTGDNVTHQFPLAGSYDVTLTVYSAGGSISSTQTIVIAQTDPTLLDIPIYNMLTGGNGKPEGKTWVIDSTQKGHFGVGPAGGTGPDYYQAGPNEKAGGGMYNDRYTFKISKFSYVFDTKGDVYMNGGQAGNFPGSHPSPVGDVTAPYTAPSDLSWSITKDDATGNQFLTVSQGGFIGYYTGVSKYQILTLNDTSLYLGYADAASPSLAWYIKLIPAGFAHYAPPPPVPQYKIDDIYENFDGTSNVTFINNSNGFISGYDNPAPVPINTSAKVGKYVKADGQGGEFANVQIKPGYKLDIRQRHVFRLKAFIPGFNDYTTTGAESWQSYQTLQKQVSVKLQNGDLGGNAYTTQAEVIQKNLAVDSWVELEFDFSSVSSRTDFDTIVIQVGGEANFTGGIFYIDDFQLLP